ncbi:MAG: ABC transporter ATP-binding protein [Alphaproteobacteria bacterium]|nr:ABC transporter ATP-binding protein [Alphaproteobacteria bacterium]
MLEINDIHVTYGRLRALKGVSLSVRQGEIVCLIGPNGAGKSTTLAAVAGGVVPHRGTIVLDGKPLAAGRPEQTARLGLSLVPEGRHVFGTLTVAENLRVATYMRRDRAAVAADYERVLNLFPRLKERIGSPGGRLSGGEQQMLVIARALLTRPRLLLVDEPSLGLAPKIVDQVYEILLAARKAEGLTLLINEQSSHRILKHADRVYVIRNGHIRLHDDAAKLADGEAIKRAYFGFGDEPAAADEPEEEAA